MKRKIPQTLLVLGIFAVSFVLSACQSDPDPDVNVRESIVKFAESKQYSFEMSLKGKGQDPSGNVTDFSGSVTGYGNTEDRKKPEGEASLTFTFTSKETSGKIGMDFRFIPGYVYLKLNELALPALAKVPPESMKSFLGQWWEVPVPEDQPLLKEAPEEQKQIIEKLKAVSLFQNVEKVGDDTVKSMESRKYRADLNREALLAFLEDANRIANKQELPASEHNAYLEGLKQVDFSGNIWVAKKEKIVNRLAGTLRSNPKDGSNFSLDFDGTFWDFGKVVHFEKPEGAVPFNPTLFLGLIGNIPGLGAPQEGEAPPDANAPKTPIDNPLGKEQVAPKTPK